MRAVIAWMAAAVALLGASGASGARSHMLLPLPVQGACSGASLRPDSTNMARVVTATLCLIERERMTYSLGLLQPNRALGRIATGQSRDMVVGDYFGDNTPTGGTPWQRIIASPYAVGARRWSAAQNIGWGTEGLATPAAMVEGWMNSPPHRQIILTGAYRDIGVGVAPAAPSRLTGGLPGATYSVEFADRK